ncbi:MAG: sulfotransferase [Anaerolineae bacterium]|nr:sulfotransferase [Anaerolineae bacterium]
MNTTSIQKRIFIVGCPRSGTTLLQSLLAAHSQIETFPESHFFEWLKSGRAVLRTLGIASPKVRRKIDQFLDHLDRPDLHRFVPWYVVTTQQYANSFVSILDTLTGEVNRNVWVEKTPGHLHHVNEIDNLVENARFVHILRSGADVVASLYDIGKKYPELWSGYTENLDRAIQRWIDDTRLSLGCRGRPNHYFVNYETLAAEARPILIDLCGWLNLPFEETMLTDYRAVASEVVLSSEPWKAATERPIAPTTGHKFRAVFTEDQQAYIMERIAQAQIDNLSVD